MLVSVDTGAARESGSEHRLALAELAARLRSVRLTPAQRAVARFILENPVQFVFMSGAEVAAEIGVSQPSVSRLAKELGYRGYGEMTAEIRELLLVGAEAAPPADSMNSYQQLMSTEIGLLEQLRDALSDPRPLDGAADMIVGANEVAVLGLRISAPVAQHFAYRLRRLRSGVSLTTTGGSATIDDLAFASQGRSSVLVAFAMSRYPSELLAALEFARQRRMKVVLFVDTPTASVVADGDHVILAPVSNGVTFGSLAAAYLLSALLIDRVAAETAAESGRRLIDLEGVAVEHGHYLEDPLEPSSQLAASKSRPGVPRARKPRKGTTDG